MIAQTLVNLSAGSRARLSGIIAAITILIIILVGAINYRIGSTSSINRCYDYGSH